MSGSEVEGKSKGKEAEYYSNDFEWDLLRRQIENDPSLSHHFLIDQPQNTSPSSQDSEAWSHFHARHFSGKFFKERRYLLKEFPELATCDEYSKVLEVGCGNGSTALPVLRGKDSIIVYACDCSKEALERATEVIDAANVISSNNRFHPFCCDFSTCGFPEWLLCESCRRTYTQKQHLCFSDAKKNRRDLTDLSLSKESKCCIGGVDYVTLIFTLSAVPFSRMPKAIAECFSVLKPGGLLLFRDYGLYDMTMLRFERGQKVGLREYMRSDGTRSYFFSLESARDLFIGAGFIEAAEETILPGTIHGFMTRFM